MSRPKRRSQEWSQAGGARKARSEAEVQSSALHRSQGGEVVLMRMLDDSSSAPAEMTARFIKATCCRRWLRGCKSESTKRKGVDLDSGIAG